MIEVYLYGELRRLAPDPRPIGQSVIRLTDVETVADVLRQLQVAEDQVGNIFLNGRLLATRNSMAPWLRYMTAGESVLDAGQPCQVALRPGDRLGLFPITMAMLVV